MNSGIAPIQNLAIIRQVKQVELTGDSAQPVVVDGKGFAKHNIQKGLLALEKQAKHYYDPSSGKVFLGGSVAPTLADICLVPQLYNAKRFEVDLALFPTLTAIQSHCAELPYFKVAVPESQPDFK